MMMELSKNPNFLGVKECEGNERIEGYAYGFMLTVSLVQISVCFRLTSVVIIQGIHQMESLAGAETMMNVTGRDTMLAL